MLIENSAGVRFADLPDRSTQRTLPGSFSSQRGMTTSNGYRPVSAAHRGRKTRIGRLCQEALELRGQRSRLRQPVLDFRTEDFGLDSFHPAREQQELVGIEARYGQVVRVIAYDAKGIDETPKELIAPSQCGYRGG